MTVWRAVIRIDPKDDPARQARAIGDGISHACALLMDEYEWGADEIVGVLERVEDELRDQEAIRDLPAIDPSEAT